MKEQEENILKIFPKKESGLTLVEMVVVLAIIGILAAFFGNSIIGIFQSGKVMQASQSIKASVIAARSDAMLVDQPVIISAQGCSLSFSYQGNVPQNSPTLPQPKKFYGVSCSDLGSLSNGNELEWTPIGFLINPTTSTMSSAEISISGVSGQTGVYFNGGGAINVH